MVDSPGLRQKTRAAFLKQHFRNAPLNPSRTLSFEPPSARHWGTLPEPSEAFINWRDYPKGHLLILAANEEEGPLPADFRRQGYKVTVLNDWKSQNGLQLPLRKPDFVLIEPYGFYNKKAGEAIATEAKKRYPEAVVVLQSALHQAPSGKKRAIWPLHIEAEKNDVLSTDSKLWAEDIRRPRAHSVSIAAAYPSMSPKELDSYLQMHRANKSVPNIS